MILRERVSILSQINHLLDNVCAGCDARQRLYEQYGRDGRTAKVDGYCVRECPVGKRLQELGEQLGKGIKPAQTAPRQRRREWMLRDDEVETVAQ